MSIEIVLTQQIIDLTTGKQRAYINTIENLLAEAEQDQHQAPNLAAASSNLAGETGKE